MRMPLQVVSRTAPDQVILVVHDGRTVGAVLPRRPGSAGAGGPARVRYH